MNAFKAERLLARTFFGRFFESDKIPPGLPQVQIVIWGIATFAAPPYMLSFGLAIKYSNLASIAPARLPDAILFDRLLFLTFAMLALGLLALVVWEGVFPDRRDVRILGVLPLRTFTHVTARVAALGALAVLFGVGVNLPAAVIYGPVLWMNNAAAGPLRGIAAHLLATMLGGLFLFFLLIAAQGLLLVVAGRRVAQRLALLLQMTFVVGLLQAFLLVPTLASQVRDAFHGGDPSIVARVPPAWFLALYDALARTPHSGHLTTYAVAAVVSTAALVAITIALLAGSHRRVVRMTLETLDDAGGLRVVPLSRAVSAIARLVMRHPVQRAAAGFTIRTVTRSRTHLMLLATYVGVAAAVLTSTLVPLAIRKGAATFDAPTVALLSAPLVLNFFTLCGIRMVIAIPTEVQANWIFRLRAPDDRIFQAVAGVRMALLFIVVAPIAAGAGIVGVALWGLWAGAVHALFTGALGMLLLDVLLIGLRKIPFTCTYYPGRSRVRTLSPAYAMAFSLYAFSGAALEQKILERPLLLGEFLVAVALVAAGLAYVRRRNLEAPPGFRYEEEDYDAIFRGFNLSEGLAVPRRNGE